MYCKHTAPGSPTMRCYYSNSCSTSLMHTHTLYTLRGHVQCPFELASAHRLSYRPLLWSSPNPRYRVQYSTELRCRGTHTNVRPLVLCKESLADQRVTIFALDHCALYCICYQIPQVLWSTECRQSIFFILPLPWPSPHCQQLHNCQPLM